MAQNPLVNRGERRLTAVEFQGLSEIPPELEWFANLNSEKTRLAYRDDLIDFREFIGIEQPEEFRTVTRAHVIAWREDMKRRTLAASTLRRKLSALSSLFEYLCEKNAVTHNPVKGVKRPKVENTNEGKTPALGDVEAKALLEAPPVERRVKGEVEPYVKGMRDRAILATLLYHGIRREELCRLKVQDYHRREGLLHLRIEGKGDKVRYVPVAPVAQRLIAEYLHMVGHRTELQSPLFRPVRNNRTGELVKPLHPVSVYQDVVKFWAKKAGITEDMHGLCVHSLRATAATNALENGADIAQVQAWLGHANVSTTRLYDKRGMRPEESPSFSVRY